MNMGHKIRIYPTPEQEELCNKSFGCARFVYNHFLGMASESRFESYNKYNKQLTALKNELPWLKEPDKYALQSALEDLRDAFNRFFSRQNRYPKFKRKHGPKQSYRTYIVANQGKDKINYNIELSKEAIKLPKLGWVKANVHKPIDGQIKSVTVSKTGSGEFYASVCVEADSISQIPSGNGEIGLDLGIKDFVVTSSGEKIANPKTLAKHEKRIALLQRNLSRKNKGSKNYAKNKAKLAKLHQKVANIRKDFQHKLSHRIVRDNQIIIIETLRVKNMLKNRRLSKAISDVSWSRFATMLEYKSKWHKREFHKVGAFFASSQLCHVCEHKNPDVKDLDIRVWECPKCKTVHDRDFNAAKNILKQGLKELKTA